MNTTHTINNQTIAVRKPDILQTLVKWFTRILNELDNPTDMRPRKLFCDTQYGEEGDGWIAFFAAAPGPGAGYFLGWMEEKE